DTMYRARNNNNPNGDYLYDADYYHYSIDGYDIYFPAIPLIIKIGDYDHSVKYSNPIVGDMSIFEDHYGSTMPNRFIAGYDSLYSSAFFLKMLGGDARGTLLRGVIKYICGTTSDDYGNKPNGYKASLWDYMVSKGITGSNSRPTMISTLLNSIISAEDILKSNLMNKYRNRPMNATKIVTLGVL